LTVNRKIIPGGLKKAAGPVTIHGREMNFSDFFVTEGRLFQS
jgi:hypothetical protein